MKKILFLLLAFCSFMAYSATSVNLEEVNKYIREKLDRDKEITFSYKVNKTNNTLEGYSDEGILCAVNSLQNQPEMAGMEGIKNKISEKNGKLNPISEIYLPDGKLVLRNTYKLNKTVNLFNTTNLIAYVNGEIPYDNSIKELYNDINSIQVEGFENGKLALFSSYEMNHKAQQVIIKNGLNAKTIITKSVLSFNGLNGNIETYYENGKINQKIAIKNGLLNGEVKKYSETTGKVIGTGTMKDGLPDGEFTEFDENGKVISKIKYKNGQEVK